MYILRIKHKSSFTRIVIVLLSFFSVQTCFGQGDFLSSQYMNSQLVINPAYAGVRNSLNVTVLSRQQWMGIENAPTSYLLSAHSPLNDRMASIGGSFLNSQNGPIQHNELTMVYSYLIKVSDRMFLSLGLSARLNHHNVNLNTLTVINESDPIFAQNIENSFTPNFGVGTFLYSPKFYLGVSMPQGLVNELKSEESEGGVAFLQQRSFYLTSGYAINIGKSAYIRPSFLARYRQEASSLIDANLTLQFKNFWVGGSYRTDQTMAALINVQVTKNVSVCYSYDFPASTETTLGVGSHEVSLLFDTNQFLKRNRDRRFGRKKKATKNTEEEDDGKRVHSIRHF